MPLFHRNRPDGTRVTDMPRLRHFLPYLLSTRNEAPVYMAQHIDVSATQDYIARWNSGTGRQPLTLFHVVMAALARVMHERPRINRFVAGRRLWQRSAVELSMVVIKGHDDDDAQMTTIKQRFAPDLTLAQTQAAIDEVIGTGRAAPRIASEKEVAVLSHLPRWVIPLVVRGQRVLDHFNLLPAVLIRNDPLYSSAMVINMGSIGIESTYHHLFNHGTMTSIVTIGRAALAPFVTDTGKIEARPMVSLRISFDERVVDGHYAARSVQRLQALIERPWLLEREGEDAPGAPLLD